MNSSSVFEMETISAFVTVADCANFTMAARKLNLTQSTISQQIKRLEDRVGKTLFLRSTRSVSLTEDGLILLDYARSMLQIAQEAHARLLSPAISGRLSVAASDDLASHWLPAVLRRYHQCYPNVRLQINVGITDELLKGADSGGYDLVLAKSLKKTANSNIIGSDQLIWVGNPELIPVAEDPLPLALFSEGCVYRRAAINSLNNAGYKWEAIVTSPSLNAIHSAVKSGIAIAPLAKSFAPENAPTIFTELPALPVIYFTLTVSPASVLKTEVIRFLEIVDEF
ncbi:TPA: LysR family transcriptional regulator [Klebsiella pneumoniae]|nr:LysR family transcriptional regulator [Klebsiella pneumoniae]HBR1477791.1 LysR family transcriptional regulator [Klebsiella pneumoniae]